jgi:2-keto-4-pentenoate hydratase/2-oxohepta-3-ene-1,7-dioic acid hydratase in catechol pathway
MDQVLEQIEALELARVLVLDLVMVEALDLELEIVVVIGQELARESAAAQAMELGRELVEV